MKVSLFLNRDQRCFSLFDPTRLHVIPATRKHNARSTLLSLIKSLSIYIDVTNIILDVGETKKKKTNHSAICHMVVYYGISGLWITHKQNLHNEWKKNFPEAIKC